MVEFLRNFYEVFPEYKTMDVSFYAIPTNSARLMPRYQTYLGGESYAGQYIPYFGMLSL